MSKTYNSIRYMGLMLSAAVALLCQPCSAALSQTASTQTVVAHDGSHDFDFLIGDWKAHLRRMVDRETGVTTSDPRTGTWVEYDGICNDKKLLDTNANFEQFEVQASRTHLRFRGQALRMYNPASHQWSIYGLDLDKGELDLPPLVGQFTRSAVNSSIPSYAMAAWFRFAMSGPISRQSRLIWNNPFRRMAVRVGP